MKRSGTLLLAALMGTILGMAFPELMAWLIVSIIFAGALIWSAREMRPTPHTRRLAGRTVPTRRIR